MKKKYFILYLLAISLDIVIIQNRSYSQNNPVFNSSEATKEYFKKNPLFTDKNFLSSDFISFSRQAKSILEKEKVTSIYEFLNNRNIKRNIPEGQYNEIKKSITLGLLTDDSTLFSLLQKDKNLVTINDFTQLSEVDVKKITKDKVNPVEIQKFIARTEALQTYKNYLITQQIISLKNPTVRFPNPPSTTINTKEEVVGIDISNPGGLPDPPKDDENDTCSISFLNLIEEPICNGDGTYSFALVFVGEDFPETLESFNLTINGQVITENITNSSLEENQAAILIENLPATGGTAEVGIQINDECYFIKENLFEIPENCDDGIDDDLFSEVGCIECMPESDIFSPAVYLLYLLDFIENNFDSDLDDLSKIEGRFFQSFDDIIITQDITNEESYVSYANKVLLNFIWMSEQCLEDANEDDDLNYNFDYTDTNIWEDNPNIYFELLQLYRSNKREFNKRLDEYPINQRSNFYKLKQRDSLFLIFKYHTAYPYPNLAKDFFESFVNEFGTTIQEVRFARLGNSAFQEQFTQTRNLTIEDLEAIDKDFDMGEGEYSQALLLKYRLKQYYIRKLHKIVKNEEIANIADEYQTEFWTKFKREKNILLQEIVKDSISNIKEFPDINNTDVFNNILAELRGIGIKCLNSVEGEGCPRNLKSSDIPLYPIKKLFEYYSEYYPDLLEEESPKSFADRKFKQLLIDIRTEHFNDLVQGYGGDASKIIIQDTLNYAERKLMSKQELEKGIQELAGYIFNYEILDSVYQGSFNWEVETRALEEWKSAVRRAEKNFHTAFRANLIHYTLEIPKNEAIIDCNYSRGDYPQTERELADFLFLDLNIVEEFRTTPIAFAISRIHTFFQYAELGISRKSIFDEKELYKNPLQNDDNDNKAIWNEWLKSYGSWHAAMMVSLYPENFLEPNLRRTKSWHFSTHFCGLGNCFSSELVSNVDELTEKLKNYWREVSNLNKLTPLDAISVLDTVLGKNLETTYFLAIDDIGQVFYSVLFKGTEWKTWRPIKKLTQMENPDELRIRVLTTYHKNKPYIYLFNIIKEEPLELSDTVPISFQPKVSRLVIDTESDAIEVLHDWKYLIGNGTYKHFKIPKGSVRGNPENLVFVTASQNTENNSSTQKFYLGIVDPSNVKGQRVISHNKVPNLKVWTFDHDIRNKESDIYKIEKPELTIDFKTHKSKWLEDVLKVKTNQSGSHLVWIKERISSNNPIYITANNKELPPNSIQQVFNSPKLIDNETYIRYFNERSNSNESYLFFSNSLYLLNGVNNIVSVDRKIDLPGIQLHGQPRNLRLLYGSEPGKSLFYIEFDTNNFPSSYSPSDREFLTEPNLSAIITDEDSKDIGTNYIVKGPAKIYNEETLFHIPMAISRRLEDSKPARAQKWINKIINLNNLNENAIKSHPLFKELDRNFRYERVPIITTKNPFDPYASADATLEIYYAHLKIQYIKYLLSEADDFFAKDNVESINRARELYELALRILELGINSDPCNTSKLHDIEGVQIKLASPIEIVKTHKLNLVLSDKTINEVTDILEKNNSNNYKVSTINYSISNANSPPKQFKYFLDRQNLSKSIYQAPTLDEVVLSRVDYNDLEYVDYTQSWKTLEVKAFCIPENPEVRQLRWRIESNLEKIRTHRNFSGIERDLPHYVVPVDPNKILSSRSYGSYSNGSSSFSKVPVYRYSFLLERAKYLVSIAEQFENSILNNEEKDSQLEFDILRYKQELELEKANISLQNLRASEAVTSIQSAEIQLSRTQTQFNHYDDLINDGLIGWEQRTLESQYTTAVAQTTSGILSAIDYFDPSDLLGSFTNIFSETAKSSSSFTSVFQTQASYERRKQDWTYQRQLSMVDKRIAQSGIKAAFDRLNIINYEQNIGELRLQFAQDKLEYLYRENKREMYNWLREEYRALHRNQMYMAISTAKAAQLALEFELKTSLDFIGYGYADYIDKDYQVYIGADKLLQDINKLEQFRITNNYRKKEVEKTFSLSNLAPAAFQEFRETGVLRFETLKEFFDRDFPGHYMRLIRDIEVSVIASIPPGGINATLFNPGISRVVTGPPFDAPSILYRYPESIALSRSFNDNGLFNLRPDDPMLLPFEGNGVATTWILEMPKGANPIDYNSIADILFTIRYTAEEDRAYRDKVLEDLGIDDYGNLKTQSKRYFSIKNDFPDQWYSLFNPQKLNSSEYHDPITEGNYDEERLMKPYTIVLDLKPEDFLPNENNKKIKKITVAIQLDNSLQNNDTLSIPLNIGFYPKNINPRDPERLAISDTFKSTQLFNGLSPFGNWIIQLPSIPEGLLTQKNDGYCFCPEKLKDILFVIDYEADIQYNR